MGKLINEIGNIYGDLTVISRAENHINPSKKPRVQWNCLCTCGNTYHNHSCGELYVESFLQSIGCQFKKEYTFSDLKDKKKLRFDFVIFNYNKPCGCIEIQGRQHYDTNNGWYNPDIVIHDKMKQQYCNENNMPLLVLNYYGQEKENFSTWDNQIKMFLQGVNNDKTN